MPEDAPAPVSDPAVPDTSATPPVSDPTPAPAAAAAEPAAEEIPGIEALPDSWQKEIRNLRAESAKHRTAAKPYTEVFDRFDEPSRQVLLDLAKTIASDPLAGAARMKELADLIEKGNNPPPAEPDPEGDRPLTRAEYEQLQKQHEEQAAQAREQAAIQQEAEGLGYTAGTRQYWSLLWSAANEHGGDLQAAHKALEAERQSAVDAFLAQKRGDAAGTPVAGSAGEAPANDNPIRTLKDARAAAEARAKSAGFR